jgi:hypothetical protein
MAGAITKLSSTAFLVGASDNVNGRVSYVSVSGTTCTENSSTLAFTDGGPVAGIAVLSPTLIHVMGQGGSFNRGTISGTSITFGTATVIASRVSRGCPAGQLVAVDSTHSLAVTLNSDNYHIYGAYVTDGPTSVSVVETALLPTDTTATTTVPTHCTFLAHIAATPTGILLTYGLSTYSDSMAVGGNIYHAMLRVKDGRPVLGAMVRNPLSDSIFTTQFTFTSVTSPLVASSTKGVGCVAVNTGPIVYNASTYYSLVLVPILTA